MSNLASDYELKSEPNMIKGIFPQDIPLKCGKFCLLKESIP
jgi:hypothetical protein